MASTRTRKPKVDEMDQTVVNESLTRQVATYLLTNASVSDCAKTLGISASSVRTITESPRYKELIEEVSEAELGTLLTKTKTRLAKLTEKAVRVVEKSMQDYLDGSGSAREALQGAQMAFKATGLHEEGEKQNDTSITVILPTGVEAPVTYEVKNDRNEDEI